MLSTIQSVKSPVDSTLYGSRIFVHCWKDCLWTEVEMFFKCKNEVCTILDGEIYMPYDCNDKEVLAEDIEDIQEYFKELEYFVDISSEILVKS